MKVKRPTQLTFAIGERVRLSELGRQRWRRMLDRSATVMAIPALPALSTSGSMENKSYTTLHSSYLEPQGDT
jgi:hypothetical protein